MSWDDLRYLLAIARAGGLGGGARALGVNHSTVYRRLHALEADLGVALFERLPDGYRPTEAGARLAAVAERVEAEVLEADRELTGRDTRLEGRLRVTCSETLAFRLLTTEIGRFQRAHPGIQVDLVVDNRPLDLARREADVALRAARPVEGDLFGRKLADIAWAVYGAADRIAVEGAPGGIEGLACHGVIGWAADAAPTRAAAWLARTVPPASISFRTSSLLNQLVAVKEGLGLAVLPCYLADPEPGLARAVPPLPDLATELWLITHGSLRATARVRAFMDLVGAGLRRALASAPAARGG